MKFITSILLLSTSLIAQLPISTSLVGIPFQQAFDQYKNYYKETQPNISDLVSCTECDGCYPYITVNVTEFDEDFNITLETSNLINPGDFFTFYDILIDWPIEDWEEADCDWNIMQEICEVGMNSQCRGQIALQRAFGSTGNYKRDYPEMYIFGFDEDHSHPVFTPEDPFLIDLLSATCTLTTPEEGDHIVIKYYPKGPNPPFAYRLYVFDIYCSKCEQIPE